jgi:hypothetical protein
MQHLSIVKISTTVILFLAGCSIVIGSFLIKKSFSNNRESEIVTDVNCYAEIRNHTWSDMNIIRYFPANIPKDARNIHMAYSAGKVFGNSFIQVRLQEPKDKIQKLLTDYRKSSQHRYYGGDTNKHSNQVNGVPTTFFYTNDSNSITFPKSYEILVLGTDNQGKATFKWNHGDSYGVAIDPSSAEIVYWAEKW